jgi:hypothetical protein
MTATSTGTAVGTAQTAAFEVHDAAELGHLCAYLSSWIRLRPSAAASLEAFTGHPDAARRVLEALGRFEVLAFRMLPSPSPDHLDQPGPLGAGETAGLAGLLDELANHGWPVDTGHARAVADDCRRWARRLDGVAR